MRFFYVIFVALIFLGIILVINGYLSSVYIEKNYLIYLYKSEWQIFQIEFFSGIVVSTTGIVLVTYRVLTRTKYYLRSRLWQTHGTKRLLLYFIVVSIGFVLFFRGVMYINGANSAANSSYYYSISNSLSTRPSIILSDPEILSNQTEIQVPTGFMNQKTPVRIDLTLSSQNYFAQNMLFQANVTASLMAVQDVTNYTRIVGIKAQLLNAIDASLDDSAPYGFRSYDYSLYGGVVYLYPPGNIGNDKTEFVGSQYFTFHNNESITYLIEVDVQQNYDNITISQEFESYLRNQNMTFQSSYNFTYSPSNFKVKSYSDLTDAQKANIQTTENNRQQTLQTRLQALLADILAQSNAQQVDSQNMNLGLSYVIVFLALIDLSFLIYENSKIDDRLETYRFKQALEEYYDSMDY